MKKTIMIITMLFTILMSHATIGLNATNQVQIPYDEHNISLVEDNSSNLLVNNSGESILEYTKDSKLYTLESVTLTRHRIKVNVEYYLGDYLTNSYVGSDSGYLDYGDYISEHLLSIKEINNRFGLSLSNSYKLFSHSLDKNEIFQTVPKYDKNNEEFVVKILIAKPKTFFLKVIWFQNRQDLPAQQNPIGLLKSVVESNKYFYKVHTTNTSFSAVEGSHVFVDSISDYTSEDTRDNRTGTLAYKGYFNKNSQFIEADQLFIDDQTPGTIYLAGFYEVDDLGSPITTPEETSDYSTSAEFGFGGDEFEWKQASIENTLLLNNSDDFNKLSSFPFHLNDDPFEDSGFVQQYETPFNFALGHKLEIIYNYKFSQQLVAKHLVEFILPDNSVFYSTHIQDGELVSSISAPKIEGYTFVNWMENIEDEIQFDFSLPISNNTKIFAMYEKNVIPEIPSEEEKPTNPSENPGETPIEKPTDKPSNNDSLPKTGIDNSILLSIAISIIGALILFYQRFKAVVLNK